MTRFYKQLKLMEEETTIACMTLECRKKNTQIQKGETYYLLGGGKVINCEACACFSTYTITVNGKPLHLERGWHKTAVSKNIKKIW